MKRQEEFYPATGYRYDGSGLLYNVSTLGYSWSDSPAGATSVTGSYLDFDSSSVNPEYGNHRSFGFPVRCVQFRNRRVQRLLAGFAEPQRNGASERGVNVIKGVE